MASAGSGGEATLFASIVGNGHKRIILCVHRSQFTDGVIRVACSWGWGATPCGYSLSYGVYMPHCRQLPHCLASIQNLEHCLRMIRFLILEKHDWNFAYS